MCVCMYTPMCMYVYVRKYTCTRPYTMYLKHRLGLRSVVAGFRSCRRLYTDRCSVVSLADKPW